MTKAELERASVALSTFLGDAEQQVHALKVLDASISLFSTYLKISKEHSTPASSEARKKKDVPGADLELFHSIYDRQEDKLVRKLRNIAAERARFGEAVHVIKSVVAEWETAILNGRPTAGTYRECVAVELRGQGFDCSGVRIHTNWVITSRHCELPTRVLVGDDVYNPITGINTFEVIDRGVIDERVRLLEVVRPTDEPTIAVLAKSCDFPDEQATIVGFGFYEPGGGPGKKRSGTVRIVATSPLTTRRDPNDVCDGDSGGPLIVNHSGGTVVYGLIDQALQVKCGTGAVYHELDAAIVSEIEQVAGITLQTCA